MPTIEFEKLIPALQPVRALKRHQVVGTFGNHHVGAFCRVHTAAAADRDKTVALLFGKQLRHGADNIGA